MVTSRHCWKVNTEEWNLHALHSFTILPDSFRLLTCSSVAAYTERKKWDIIDSDSPPTAVWRLRYWLPSLVTELSQPWPWIAEATGCDMCHVFLFFFTLTLTGGALNFTNRNNQGSRKISQTAVYFAGSMTAPLEPSAPLHKYNSSVSLSFEVKNAQLKKECWTMRSTQRSIQTTASVAMTIIFHVTAT